MAALGVVVLIVAIAALRNPKQVSTNAGTDTRVVTIVPSVSPSTGPASSRSVSTRSSRPRGSGSTTVIGSLPLIVLNDTQTPHLARDAAGRFENDGWHVTSYDENYRNTIISTCAYFDPADTGAQQAARALQKQFPTIKRVLPRFAELPSGPIVVVLTADY